jgi:hypothetical protein
MKLKNHLRKKAAGQEENATTTTTKPFIPKQVGVGRKRTLINRNMNKNSRSIRCIE